VSGWMHAYQVPGLHGVRRAAVLALRNIKQCSKHAYHLVTFAGVLPQKGAPDAVALNGAAAALLRSGSLRPRIIASLRAASSGFRQLCQEHEVGIA
jgi:hypothetical protein